MKQHFLRKIATAFMILCLATIISSCGLNSENYLSETSTDTTIEHTEKISLSDTTESTTIPKNEPIISTAKSPEPSEATLLITDCGNDEYNNQVEHDFSYHSAVGKGNTDTTTELLESDLKSEDTTSIDEESSEMEIKAIYHDTSIDISNTNNSFVDLVRKIIENECVLELQETLNDSKINKFCSEGCCVLIQYTEPQTYEINSRNNVMELETNSIYLLVDTEKNQSLIGIVCGSDTKVYPMSKESAESLLKQFAE
jgi:hypothetical protein